MAEENEERIARRRQTDTFRGVARSFIVPIVTIAIGFAAGIITDRIKTAAADAALARQVEINTKRLDVLEKAVVDLSHLAHSPADQVSRNEHYDLIQRVERLEQQNERAHERISNQLDRLLARIGVQIIPRKAHTDDE